MDETLLKDLEHAALCCQPGSERRALLMRAFGRIKELHAEAFALSAGVCPHLRGNEHGNAYCGKTNELI